MDHQNLSEHVLCMVLYLIELGLENSAEEESDEEVSKVLLFLNTKVMKCLYKVVCYLEMYLWIHHTN